MLNSVLLLYLFSIILVTSAFMLILSQNPVFSLLFLVTSFIFSSFLLFLLECEFLALLFILIYVGAICILFLFAIMMLESNFGSLSNNSIIYLPFGIILCFFLFFFFIQNISFQFSENYCFSLFYFNVYQNWYDLIDSVNDIEIFGQILYSYYLLPFLVVGLILCEVLYVKSCNEIKVCNNICWWSNIEFWM